MFSTGKAEVNFIRRIELSDKKWLSEDGKAKAL